MFCTVIKMTARGAYIPHWSTCVGIPWLHLRDLGSCQRIPWELQLMAQVIRILPAMWETQLEILALGFDLTHCCFLQNFGK